MVMLRLSEKKKSRTFIEFTSLSFIMFFLLFPTKTDKTMSNTIPFNKRYIYNLDPSILESLQTLYFDSITFEQKSYEEYISRRKDEIEDTTNVQRADLFTKPVIVRPKARASISQALSNLSTSMTEKQQLEDSSSEGELNDSNTESESDMENEDESRGEELYRISENVDDDHQSTISFMSTKSPMILFKSPIIEDDNKCFGIYKVSINAIDSPNFDPISTLRNITYNTENTIPKDPIQAGMSAIFMMSSGHFAGAIISHLPHSTKGNKGTATELHMQSVRMLAHKTFHRYTTRRKQGGSQSAMDDAKGKANSAGSTLRRYNEQALGKDIEELMEEWKPLLDQCTSIYIRGSGKGGKNARGTGLIVRDSKDPKAIIKTGDKRVKFIPFATKRPTTMEIKRTWCELSYLHVVDVPAISKTEIEKKRKREELLQKSKEESHAVDNELADKIKLSNDLIQLLKKSKAPALIAFMKKNQSKIDVNFRLQPADHYETNPTLLHYASRKSLPFMVQTLMVQLHADPTILNSLGQTAYEIAGDKDTRYAFRFSRHILGEHSGISWIDSGVGSAMTKDEIELAKSKDKQQQEEIADEEKKELKKQHNAIVQDFREREQSKAKHTSTITGPGLLRVSEEQKLSGLSEAQRMKVLREQRFRAIEARLKRAQS